MSAVPQPATARQAMIGRLLVVGAVLMWSLGGFFGKAPIFESWDPAVRGPLLAFWRSVFAGLVLVPIVRRPFLRWTLIPTTLTFAAMVTTYLMSMTLTTAANTIWLQNTAPVWVFLCGVLLLKEPIHRRDWGMLACGMLGVGIILFFELGIYHLFEVGRAPSSAGVSPAGVVLGLLSGLFYAGIVIAMRQFRHDDPAWVIVLCHAVSAAVLFPLVLRWGIWPTPGQLGMLAAFGALQLGVPYVLFAYGLRYITGHEGAGIAMLEPVILPLWVWLAWGNTPTYMPPAWWTFAGGACIFAGLLVRYVGPGK